MNDIVFNLLKITSSTAAAVVTMGFIFYLEGLL
jgi:hypothetical protein